MYRTATMCRVLGVSPSGYYAWRRRAPCARVCADQALTERIEAIHERSRGTYGVPRVHAELADLGVPVGGVDPVWWTPDDLGVKEVFTMPQTHPRYPMEFRCQMVELVRAGRTPEALAHEFEPSAQTIRTWAHQADVDEGRRKDGLTSDEREELRRLRRENRQLRQEREILAKAAAWFARETDSIPSGSTGS